MDKRFTCYCGLYCENCAYMAKITPAAKVLYDEMRKAGFEEIIHLFPGGDVFLPFLKRMAKGICVSCKDGSGDPGCKIRKCAKKKDVKMCALCEKYPCEKFDAIFQLNPILKHDNALIREQGMSAWAKLQDERRMNGFTYADERTGSVT